MPTAAHRCGLVVDAVANGLVASFNRPGGNVTGMTILAADLTSRRLQLLTEMVPGLERVAVLTNPSDPNQASQIKQAQTAAQSLTVELHVAEAAAPDKFESAFATIAVARAQALIVLQSALFFNQYPRIWRRRLYLRHLERGAWLMSEHVLGVEAGAVGACPTLGGSDRAADCGPVSRD